LQEYPVSQAQAMAAGAQGVEVNEVPYGAPVPVEYATNSEVGALLLRVSELEKRCELSEENISQRIGTYGTQVRELGERLAKRIESLSRMAGVADAQMGSEMARQMEKLEARVSNAESWLSARVDKVEKDVEGFAPGLAALAHRVKTIEDYSAEQERRCFSLEKRGEAQRESLERLWKRAEELHSKVDQVRFRLAAMEPKSVAPSDRTHEQLQRFYGVENIVGLVKAMERHIQNLQRALPPDQIVTRSTPREG
jgi:chromosome segregation ATPase